MTFEELQIGDYFRLFGMNLSTLGAALRQFDMKQK
jgi:hypothetical protein